METPPPPLDFRTVAAESKRILNAHSRHFLALSVLFLLPLSFSLTVYPTLVNLIELPSTHNTKIFISLDDVPSLDDVFTAKTLILTLGFSLFVFACSLLAVGSITYSVFHGFYGRPVKLFSAIKSALASFFPLLVTVGFAQFIVSGVLLAFGCFFFLLIEGAELLGFEVQFSSPAFIAISAVLGIGLVFALGYLQLKWTLACVVVVVESSWGLEPLKRSSFLISGMRRVAFSSLMFYAFFAGIWVWTSSSVSSHGDVWKNWGFVVIQTVMCTALLLLVCLQNVASTTVLYMHCKAFHGELAWEIAEEFARDYVSLPFDDGKVPHVVSVAYA